MIKVEIVATEQYKDLGIENGSSFYALPTIGHRKKVWFLGIKIFDKSVSNIVDSKYKHKNEKPQKTAGY